MDEADEDLDEVREREEKHRRRERGRRVDFDVQFGGLSPGGRQRNSWLKADPDSLFGLNRVTSEDGRRDGWLVDSSNGSSSRSEAVEKGDSLHRSQSEAAEEEQEQTEDRLAVEGQDADRRPSSIRQMGDIEIEMARVTGNKPWQRIFDGRDNN